MDSVKEIMERLGFREDGDDSTKAAFVKNLIKQAYGVDVSVPSQYRPKPKLLCVSDLEEQLCFPFMDESEVG